MIKCKCILNYYENTRDQWRAQTPGGAGAKWRNEGTIVAMQLIESALLHDTIIFFLKADRGDIFIVHDQNNPHIVHLYPRQKSQTGGTGPKGHFSVGPQRSRKGF